MFFYLSKILWIFARPSNLLVFWSGVGLLLTLRRKNRWTKAFALSGLLLLTLAAFFPLGNMLILPLESRFPTKPVEGLNPDGVIVLAGAEYGQMTAARGQTSLTAAAERLLFFLQIAEKYPEARLVFSGATGRITPQGLTADQVAERFAQEQGFAVERILFERQSRNTYESVLLSKELAKPAPNEHWVVITSASHIPRSMGIFRQLDWHVTPFPVDYKTLGELKLAPAFHASGHLMMLDGAVHEWLGLIAYWLTDRSSSVFPGPEMGVSIGEAANSRD
jgi:uncharacterized SAM-binding protein YcdF (DUF218 family)